jgi:hypothetical protein
MGIEAAIMVVAPSAPPQMVTATVSAAGVSRRRRDYLPERGNIPASPVSFGSMAILTNDAAPALGVVSKSRCFRGR